MRPSRFLLLLFMAVLLGAVPAAAADCPGADLPAGSTDTISSRAAIVCLTNVERADAGLAALEPEGRLEAAAQAYSGQLVSEHFFAHVTPEGLGLLDRLKAYLGWRRVGENLAWGEGERGTPRAIVAAWMASAGHRANVLSVAFTEVGIGMIPGTPTGSSRPSATYVAEYGVRDSGEAPWPVEGATPARATVPVAAAASRSRKASTAKKAQKARKADKTRKARKAKRRCRRGIARRRVFSHGRVIVRCVSKRGPRGARAQRR